ncbi:hypothetical protein [Chamaesiphon sp. VAR_48_metabat_403]|uniref:hypothetical protein n=1 Tax=Chamaesiphon sp. VAR_48_metabat_403 TaxID=2964700 RepID=UPI00286DEF64|nr:hypothetical protein [Chamaesiphon sp. VAR_48_metabat_403]
MSKFELCEKFGLTIIFGLLLTHTDLAFSSQSNRPKVEIQKPIVANIQAQNSDADGCEAYAAGYAVARTKRYYIAICGGSNRKNMSFYAAKTNDTPEQSERGKIQIDNVSFKNGTYTATRGRDTYILTPRLFSLRRDGKILVRETVVKYTNLSRGKQDRSKALSSLNEIKFPKSLIQKANIID